MCGTAHRAFGVQVCSDARDPVLERVIPGERLNRPDARGICQHFDHGETNADRVQRHQRRFDLPVAGIAASEPDPAERLWFQVFRSLTEIDLVGAGETRATGQVERHATPDVRSVASGFHPYSDIQVRHEVGGCQLADNQACAVIVDTANNEVNLAQG